MPHLQSTFEALVMKFTEEDKATVLWKEIEKHYRSSKRYYHTLNHLENLLSQLEGVKAQIEDREAILFCLYYHDIIYNAARHDNEEKSAALAEKRLREIGFPEARTKRCVEHILATKDHRKSTDPDTNFFTDADLSILGSDTESYLEYSRGVREEYRIYPDFLYNPGRSKALSHFLEMDRIFKTEYFYQKLESKARENIRLESDLLSGK